jgi:hypothetical protein
MLLTGGGVMPKNVSPAELRQPLSDTITEVPELSAAPTEREIAEEAAKIYPDTNDGPPDTAHIAAEAYKIYLGRGSADGRDVDDWLEAERRLRSTRPGQ